MLQCLRLWMLLGQREFTATGRAELLFAVCRRKTDSRAELQHIFTAKLLTCLSARLNTQFCNVIADTIAACLWVFRRGLNFPHILPNVF